MATTLIVSIPKVCWVIVRAFADGRVEVTIVQCRWSRALGVLVRAHETVLKSPSECVAPHSLGSG